MSWALWPRRDVCRRQDGPRAGPVELVKVNGAAPPSHLGPPPAAIRIRRIMMSNPAGHAVWSPVY